MKERLIGLLPMTRRSRDQHWYMWIPYRILDKWLYKCCRSNYKIPLLQGALMKGGWKVR